LRLSRQPITDSYGYFQIVPRGGDIRWTLDERRALTSLRVHTTVCDLSEQSSFEGFGALTSSTPWEDLMSVLAHRAHTNVERQCRECMFGTVTPTTRQARSLLFGERSIELTIWTCDVCGAVSSDDPLTAEANRSKERAVKCAVR
jgi:hypothetical protein